MTSGEIRKKFLEFFKERGHVVIPSSSLIPEGDATTLFTGSGMQPLIKYLLGEKHPQGTRLVNSQKSFRAEDIEEVGDSRHTTFFEMLGNWSLGDYFKEQQIPWMFEFLTNSVGIDPARLYVTCFIGAPECHIPKDTETADIWKKLFAEKGIEAREADIGSEASGCERGIKPGERIFYYDDHKNWWNRGKAGLITTPIGDPCGPDSEMFYDFGTPHDKKFGEFCHPNCDCGRFMEIGNNVFMEYKKKGEGIFEKLAHRNVDFGGGLERITAASLSDPDMFHIDSLKPLIDALPTDSTDLRVKRIIADHVRAASFFICDGVRPSNKDQGYVLRRLLRRAIVHADLKGITSVAAGDTQSMGFDSDLKKLFEIVIKIYAPFYPELNLQTIMEVFNDERKKFGTAFRNGLREMKKVEQIDGTTAFHLYESYGLPFELIKEFGGEKATALTHEEFDMKFKEHQEKSRAGAEKKFGGHGLILDTGELKAANEEELKIVTRLHTATHMLQQALREVLGNEVHQAGSDITVERTRFDFTFPRKLTPEEIKKIEALVNEKIAEDLPTQKITLPKAEAEKTGALYFFKEKYPDPVNVYFIGKNLESAWSKEFCGGPHVTHTGEIGHFKIAKEEAVAAGVRRIRGVVES